MTRSAPRRSRLRRSHDESPVVGMNATNGINGNDGIDGIGGMHGRILAASRGKRLP